MTRESDFRAVLEGAPPFAGRVEGGDEVPLVGVVLAEQAVVLPVPHQLHPVGEKTNSTISASRVVIGRKEMFYLMTHSTHLI